jgi:hypothetical protein
MNKLVELIYNEQQKNEIIITNFVKMLYNRHYFGDSDLNDLIKSGINNFTNYKTFIKYNNEIFHLIIIPYKLNTINMPEQEINKDNITSVTIDPKGSVLLPKNDQIIFNEVIEYRPNNKFILNDGHLILLVLCTLKKLMPPTE